MNTSLPPFAVLSGPTGSGKSQVALEFAVNHGGIEIVNADSIAWVRGFDVGSAKPSPDERARVPHHLIDVFEPSDRYTAKDFVEAADRAIADIHGRGKRPLLVGGSGFYLKAWLHGMWDAPTTNSAFRASLSAESSETLYARLKNIDAVHAHKLHPNDRYRVIRALEVWTLSGTRPSDLEEQKSAQDALRYPIRLLIVDREKEELNQRLELRARQMLALDWIEETQKLRESFPDAPALTSVGYLQIMEWLDGRKPQGRKLRPGQEGLIDEIVLATRGLVKSQRTWFRGQKSAEHFLLDNDLKKLFNQLKEIYS